MLVGPAVRSSESGAREGAGGELRPALDDLVCVEKLAVHAKAVLKPHMGRERLGALIRPGQEQVAARSEQRIDAIALRELVPHPSAQQ
jgi:hypothetical protein